MYALNSMKYHISHCSNSPSRGQNCLYVYTAVHQYGSLGKSILNETLWANSSDLAFIMEKTMFLEWLSQSKC